jgi:hypothetical protein
MRNTAAPEIWRPLSGPVWLLIRGSWGSRPRLTIYRRWVTRLVDFLINRKLERFTLNIVYQAGAGGRNVVTFKRLNVERLFGWAFDVQ